MNHLLKDLLMDTPNDAGKLRRIQDIAERLGKVRREKGLTQVEMAKRLKTTQSMYSRYESGEIRIYADVLFKIAQILGVTPNELFGVTKSGGHASEPIEHDIPKRFIRKLRGVGDLTKTQQDSLLMLIDATVNHGKKKKASISKAEAAS